MNEIRHRLRSAHLGNERDVWIRPPLDGVAAEVLLVFLDAELYRDRVKSHEIVDALEAAGDVPPAWVVHVSHHSVDARWVECPCHPPFASFVIAELMPWLADLHPETRALRERVLIGLSYTGLAASFVALQPDQPFTTVISQSGSYWWEDGWLTRHYAALPVARPVRFHLEVGDRETQAPVRHKEDLVQTTAQIDAVRAFRDALLDRGYEVHYSEFDGGHECGAWARTLPAALRWATRSAMPPERAGSR